jgi:hypothetical protein
VIRELQGKGIGHIIKYSTASRFKFSEIFIKQIVRFLSSL